MTDMANTLRAALRSVGFRNVQLSSTGRVVADYLQYDLFFQDRPDGTYSIYSNHGQLTYVTTATSGDPLRVAHEIKQHILVLEVMES